MIGVWMIEIDYLRWDLFEMNIGNYQMLICMQA